MLMTIAVSLPLGIWSAIDRNRFWNHLIRVVSFLGNAMPGFFVGLLLIYLFSVRSHLFSIMHTHADLRGVFLPALTLAIAMTAKYLRQVRATVLEELSKPYLRGARARGIRFRITLRRSVLRAALVSL